MDIREILERRRKSNRETKLEREIEHKITRGGKNERGDSVDWNRKIKNRGREFTKTEMEEGEY